MSSKSTRQLFTNLCLHMALICLASFIVLPVLFMLFGSFKSMSEIFAYPPKFFPSSLKFDNYVKAWNSAPFGRFLFNSTFVAVVTTLGELVIATLAAYAFSHLKPRGANLVFLLIMSGMMIPSQATIIPRFFIMTNLGLTDTYTALILPFIARPMGIFLLYQFFRTSPKELQEAATLEGCGALRFLVQILVPLSRAPLGALSILSFVASWNRFMWPLIIVNSTSMQTAPIGISMFIDQTEGSLVGVMMAGAIIVISPAILAFIMGQKQFVKALTSSSIKG